MTRLASFRRPGDGATSFGLVAEDQVVDCGRDGETLLDVLRQGKLSAREPVRDVPRYALGDIAFLPPVVGEKMQCRPQAGGVEPAIGGGR